MCKNGAHYEVRTRPAYAHFSILGAQERNCRLDEGSGTSREIGSTLGKGTAQEKGEQEQRRCQSMKMLRGSVEALGCKNCQSPPGDDRF